MLFLLHLWPISRMLEDRLYDCSGATRVGSHYADDWARHIGGEPPYGILCVASAYIAPQDAAMMRLGWHLQG